MEVRSAHISDALRARLHPCNLTTSIGQDYQGVPTSIRFLATLGVSSVSTL